MSVVGESVAEHYPDAANQMRGLVVSTIYVNVGFKKSWILEYWPSAADNSSDRKSGATGMEAPWPYVMFQPDAEIPPDADAVLVRASLNTDGQLGQFTLLLPAEWAQKDSLFRALAQWKFRPASRNGQARSVEVLLVVPRQPEG